jgi:hypothetical protein
MDQRQFTRFPFNEPVNYQSGEDPSNGSLAGDISEGGVRIRVQEFIPLRTILSLKIHMNNPPRVVPIKGQVMWVREVPESEVFDIGIRFLERITNTKESM